MTDISKNILLISGSGRNIGKTSFIRRVIAKNAVKKPVAIKITPHFHEPTDGLVAVSINDGFRVYQETNNSSDKDSSLFLQAGAEKVFYIQTTDLYLNEAFSHIANLLSPEQPIIVESAALRKYIVPGLYIFIQKKYEDTKQSALEMQKLADVIIYSESGQFSIDPVLLTFNQTWKL